MANQFVAFLDERHGLGAWVAEQIAADIFRNPAEKPRAKGARARQNGESADLSARAVSTADLSLSLFASGRTRRFSPDAPPVGDAPAPSVGSTTYRTWTSPRASAEATAASVISGQAQVGVLPLYDEGEGFNRETLAALMDFPQQALGEYVAESNYVLAVPTDLIHEVDQAGFSDSFDPQGTRGFSWTAEKQRKYRGRLGTVYASADALRHCTAAIEGMRARGIDVQRLPDGTDTYREGLRIAHGLLDPNRQVEVSHGRDGQRRVSKTKGGNHAKPLIGVLLSFDKALGDGGYSFDSDYQVLEAGLAGAEQVRTSFIATTKLDDGQSRDHDTLSDDLASVERFFREPKHSPDRDPDGILGNTAALGARDSRRPIAGGPFPYARLLFAVPTVGREARDHSAVLARLAEEKVSYRTQPMDQREGMPVVIAIDVPKGQLGRVKPALKELRKLPGARRIATFPSVTPMVADEFRPAPAVSPQWRIFRRGAAVIVLALGAFVAWSLAGNS